MPLYSHTTQADSTGDDAQTARLEELADSYDPEPYWSETHPYLLSTIQCDTLHPSRSFDVDFGDDAIKEDQKTPGKLPRDTCGRNEDISGFLARLPPSSAPEDVVGPWIWVKNPHRPKQDSQAGDSARFIAEGTRLLRDFEDRQSDLKVEHDRSGAQKAALTRKLKPLCAQLAEDIFTIARETKVTCGKWMLFPAPNRVDEVWETVARATVAGELGIESKVATKPSGTTDKTRLLVVYTRDYADLADMKRVVEKLKDLGLVTVGMKKPIYYKTDAYSWLDITSTNPYGLKASLYNSDNVLGKVLP